MARAVARSTRTPGAAGWDGEADVQRVRVRPAGQERQASRTDRVRQEAAQLGFILALMVLFWIVSWFM